MPTFLIPTITENLARGGSTEYATLVLAAWCYYSDKGVDRHGKKLEIVDGMKEELHKAAADTANDKLSFLRLETVFGHLAQENAFTEVYVRMIDSLYENPDIAKEMQALLFGRE